MMDDPAMPAMPEELAGFAAGHGIDLAVIGPATVRSAVRARMHATECDAGSYRRLLARDAGEQQELLEGLLVPETWFFRDAAAFDLLQQSAVEHRRGNRGDAPFRVLSLACSTGEEIWSIAIVLHEAGLLPSQIRIDGLDLSRSAVAAAQSAIYGPHSFRGSQLGNRERFFQDLGEGRREVTAALRACATIATGNLLDPAPEQTYDAIFCRNVMIYMTTSARQRTVERARSGLAPGGLFFVGHADAPAAAEAGFRRHPTAGAFAWVRGSDARLPSPRRATEPTRQSKTGKPLPPKSSTRTAQLPDTDEPAKGSVPDGLSEIRRLADGGHYDDAEQACQRILQRRPLDPDALALLGLIAMATGRRDEAIGHLRRAVYLDPSHPEGRALLSLLQAPRSPESTSGRNRPTTDPGSDTPA
ncbi:CheR family methyltransferase [Methylotetracoccus oryzae]|uniref:CheR family methyltransferase n=1 Tax=Methylotetracoccus oryzae TaxID=1919059 RepID=UPI00111B4BAE|nr:CheR family methyltransferase [Methylotetracoccus oryzae]